MQTMCDVTEYSIGMSSFCTLVHSIVLTHINMDVDAGVCKSKLMDGHADAIHTFLMFTKLTASLAACTTAVCACSSQGRMQRLS